MGPAGKGGALAILIGKEKPPMGGPEEGHDDLRLAVSDFMAAVKTGDVGAATSAYRMMHDICGGYGGGEEV